MVGRSLFALVFLLAACGAKPEEKPAAAGDAPLVQVVAVAPMSAAGAVRASGMIGYKREPVLAFTAPGVIGSLAVDSGDVVRRGQRLATLRRTGAGANLDEAALARQTAESNYNRIQALHESGFASDAQLENARLAVERARDSSVLTAPADGVILRRAVDPSQTVASGAPIFILGETGSGLVVRAPVSSTDAARVHVGDVVAVRLSGGEPRAGKVTRVGAKGDEGTGAFEVEVEITAADGLRSGMVAEVEIAAAADPSMTAAILVPTLSLLDARADQGIVFVVDDGGVARRRAVRTLGITQAGVLVAEGLTAGERVVSAGAAYVRDGEPVRIAPVS